MSKYSCQKYKDPSTYTYLAEQYTICVKFGIFLFFYNYISHGNRC